VEAPSRARRRSVPWRCVFIDVTLVRQALHPTNDPISDKLWGALFLSNKQYVPLREKRMTSWLVNNRLDAILCLAILQVDVFSL
jgi:hypothetical protein